MWACVTMQKCIIKSFMFMGTKATEAAKKAKVTITAAGSLQVLPSGMQYGSSEMPPQCPGQINGLEYFLFN